MAHASPRVLGPVLLLLLLAACEAYYLPNLVAATVTCMGAACTSCVEMPVEDINDTLVVLRPCILIDFEDHHMAVHFLGVLDGETVIDKEISGMMSPAACYARDLMLCLRFHDVNSQGSSLQVCTTLEGGIVNNPAATVAALGCFLADTQSRTVRHRTSPRPTAKTAG